MKNLMCIWFTTHDKKQFVIVKREHVEDVVKIIETWSGKVTSRLSKSHSHGYKLYEVNLVVA
jgi:hypothetical protein